jgi:fructose-bisphosphate aldolase, class II
MLLNMNELLKVAEENNFSIGAFNCTELSNFRCVIDEAERQNSPTIIQANVGEYNFATREYYNFVRTRLMNSNIPFVLHLDHGKSLQDCLRAIQAGFTSVMIDGSLLSYEENIELTRKVAEIAHLVDISVEGEIGTIGVNDNSDEGGAKNIQYTDPDQAADFVKRTGIDSLAVAIGTAHGIYPKGFVPKLQLELLKKIKSKVSVPLVLHGGSDNPDDEIRKACELGIKKLNISSDFKSAYSYELQRIMNETSEFKFAVLMPAAMEPAQAVLRHKMDLLNSINKAYYYYPSPINQKQGIQVKEYASI